MPQLFYASFTEASLSQEDEEYFWRNFAASDGVRLTIDITATNPNFRKIVYEPKPGTPIPLLTDLVSTIRQQHGREFVLQGISRLCASTCAVRPTVERRNIGLCSRRGLTSALNRSVRGRLRMSKSR